MIRSNILRNRVHAMRCTFLRGPLLVNLIALLAAASAPGGDGLPPVPDCGKCNIGGGWITIASPTAYPATTEYVAISMSGKALTWNLR